MKTFLTTCFLCFTFFARGQNVVQVEYFIDTDAGVGNNSIVNVTPSPDGDFPFVANSTGVSNGHHYLYVRTKDSDGNWSLTARRSIVVSPQNKINIVRGEYFIDADPGFGNAAAITVSPQDSLIMQNFTAAVAGLQPGLHKLYARFLDSYGNWSITFRRNIEVINSFDPENVASVEYFFTDDNGVGNCASIPLSNPLPDGTFPFIIPKDQIPADIDTLFLRVKGGIDNDWSITQYRVGLIVLPLTLLNFTVARQDNSVQLHWQTTNEVNVSHFNIQRSVNGNSFSTIDKVNARGSSAQNNYNFTDNIKSITVQKIYYRLQITDKDGSIQYSPVRAINNLNTFSVSINSNPIMNNILNVSISNNKRANLQLHIYTAEGKLVLSQRFNTEGGGINKQININNLASGIYVLQIGDGAQVQRLKIFKN